MAAKKKISSAKKTANKSTEKVAKTAKKKASSAKKAKAPAKKKVASKKTATKKVAKKSAKKTPKKSTVAKKASRKAASKKAVKPVASDKKPSKKTTKKASKKSEKKVSLSKSTASASDIAKGIAARKAAAKAKSRANQGPVRAKRKTSQRKLTKKQSAQYEASLIRIRDELSRQIAFLRGTSLTRSDEVNPEEDGTDAFERQLALKLAANEGDAVFEIDEALHRIKDGTYAVCEDCGCIISSARLKALPFARQCVECKSLSEKNGGYSQRRFF